MNPSDRTHNLLREKGIRCGKVERFVSQKHTADLFGFLDQVALNPEGVQPFAKGLFGIQSTGGDSNGNGNARIAKIRSAALWPAAQAWLDCGAAIYVFSWVRVPLGKSVRYELRVVELKDQEHEFSWEPICGDPT